MSKVVELVTDIMTDILADTAFELFDVEFTKEGQNWFLRVFVDKADGIDIDECATISEQLSDRLDSIHPDPIPQAYFLEVSSPGAERPIKTEQALTEAIGNYIHLSFYKMIDQVKFVEGTLTAFNTETITLQIKDKTRVVEKTFERKDVAKIRYAIEF